MKLYFKNMVCNRCKTIVRDELEKIGIQYDSLDLGVVNTKADVLPLQRCQLSIALQESGIELIEENKTAIIEKLKMAVLDVEHNSDEELKTGFTDYISSNVDDNFASLNLLFAEIEGVSIEKYIINKKIERVKELLVYDKYNLTEIAVKLHYSSTAQLSNQFRKVTGLAPMHFKKLRQHKNGNQPCAQSLNQNPA